MINLTVNTIFFDPQPQDSHKANGYLRKVITMKTSTRNHRILLTNIKYKHKCRQKNHLENTESP
jgi:hypothetical protein